MGKKKEVILLVTGFAGIMLGVFLTRLANMGVLQLPIQARMVLLIPAYWIVAAAPVALAVINKEKPADFGFSKDKIGLQIIIGIGLGLAMSAVLTLVPHLVGLGGFVDSGNRYKYIWQFSWEFLYCIAGVGLVEEFAFRGFIYKRCKNLFGKEFLAVICSSALFGLFHVFNGSIVQMVMTGLIGALFCFFRLKIRNCTMLSIVIAHGVYDAMITVLAAVFLT